MGDGGQVVCECPGLTWVAGMANVYRGYTHRHPPKGSRGRSSGAGG